MNTLRYRFSIRKKTIGIAKGIFVLGIVSSLLVGFGSRFYNVRASKNFLENFCEEPHLDVAPPLNDLGENVYIRMDGQNTGEIGGLYPQGSNVRPPQHEANGLAVADQIVPLDVNGSPDQVNGKVVFISIGMSNTSVEFRDFIDDVHEDPDVNQQLILVDGAQSAQTADQWVDPNAQTWQNVYQSLSDVGLTPAQVQVAWVKLMNFYSGSFPGWSLNLQADLEDVTRNLKTNFPNIKITYFSSRTRSYLYWDSYSPEPAAYESGFSVRWMIVKQINGVPSLNFDPSKGEAVAPYLSWGPYLWIDGENLRSDGQVWRQDDLQPDCVHPSTNGRVKVVNMLMDFFKTDTTSVGWFLMPPRPSFPPENFLPVIFNELNAP